MNNRTQNQNMPPNTELTHNGLAAVSNAPSNRAEQRLHHDDAYTLRQIAREKAVFLYCNALERGDFDTVSQVLQQAEIDEVLEGMILDMHGEDIAATEAEAFEDARAHLQGLLALHLPSGTPSATRAEVLDAQEDISEVRPVTISDVAARMQADAVQPSSKTGVKRRMGHGQSDLHPAHQNDSSLLQRLRRLHTPLPDKLNQHNLQRFFENLGLAVPPQMQKAFRETALYLLMGRQQDIAQLAATRRQRQKSQTDPSCSAAKPDKAPGSESQ